jgi:hypothetical protein
MNMKKLIGAALVTVFFYGLAGTSGAEGDKESLAILDKAIKALGGEEKLKAAKAFTSKAKGTITFGDMENAFTSQTTVQGLDHARRQFEGEFGGNKFQAVTVVAGNKGWRQFGDNVMELDDATLGNEKRTLYLQVVATTILPLQGKGFKVTAAGEDKVGNSVAVVIKATGPDGKDFKLYFDKTSGLPVKQVAVVADFMNNDYTQETIFKDYKESDGIKRATKVEIKRDGAKLIEQETTEFKVLAKVDPKTFAELK